MASRVPPERNPNLYGVLGLSFGAPVEDVKRSFKALALRYHPDKNTSSSPSAAAAEGAAAEDPAERFKGIAEAYQILGNEERKASYDALFDPRQMENFYATVASSGLSAAMRKGAAGGGSSSQQQQQGSGQGQGLFSRMHSAADRWNVYGAAEAAEREIDKMNTKERHRAASKHRSGGGARGASAAPPAETRYTAEQQEYFRTKEKERLRGIKKRMEREREEANEKQLEAIRKAQTERSEQEKRYAAAAAAMTTGGGGGGKDDKASNSVPPVPLSSIGSGAASAGGGGGGGGVTGSGATSANITSPTSASAAAAAAAARAYSHASHNNNTNPFPGGAPPRHSTINSTTTSGAADGFSSEVHAFNFSHSSSADFASPLGSAGGNNTPTSPIGPPLSVPPSMMPSHGISLGNGVSVGSGPYSSILMGRGPLNPKEGPAPPRSVSSVAATRAAGGGGGAEAHRHATPTAQSTATNSMRSPHGAASAPSSPRGPREGRADPLRPMGAVGAASSAAESGAKPMGSRTPGAAGRSRAASGVVGTPSGANNSAQSFHWPRTAASPTPGSSQPTAGGKGGQQGGKATASSDAFGTPTAVRERPAGAARTVSSSPTPAPKPRALFGGSSKAANGQRPFSRTVTGTSEVASDAPLPAAASAPAAPPLTSTAASSSSSPPPPPPGQHPSPAAALHALVTAEEPSARALIIDSLEPFERMCAHSAMARGGRLVALAEALRTAERCAEPQLRAAVVAEEAALRAMLFIERDWSKGRAALRQCSREERTQLSWGMFHARQDVLRGAKQREGLLAACVAEKEALLRGPDGLGGAPSNTSSLAALTTVAEPFRRGAIAVAERDAAAAIGRLFFATVHAAARRSVAGRDNVLRGALAVARSEAADRHWIEAVLAQESMGRAAILAEYRRAVEGPTAAEEKMAARGNHSTTCDAADSVGAALTPRAPDCLAADNVLDLSSDGADSIDLDAYACGPPSYLLTSPSSAPSPTAGRRRRGRRLPPNPNPFASSSAFDPNDALRRRFINAWEGAEVFTPDQSPLASAASSPWRPAPVGNSSFSRGAGRACVGAVGSAEGAGQRSGEEFAEGNSAFPPSLWDRKNALNKAIFGLYASGLAVALSRHRALAEETARLRAELEGHRSGVACRRRIEGLSFGGGEGVDAMAGASVSSSDAVGGVRRSIGGASQFDATANDPYAAIRRASDAVSNGDRRSPLAPTPTTERGGSGGGTIAAFSSRSQPSPPNNNAASPEVAPAAAANGGGDTNKAQPMSYRLRFGPDTVVGPKPAAASANADRLLSAMSPSQRAAAARSRSLSPSTNAAPTALSPRQRPRAADASSPLVRRGPSPSPSSPSRSGVSLLSPPSSVPAPQRLGSGGSVGATARSSSSNGGGSAASPSLLAQQRAQRRSASANADPNAASPHSHSPRSLLSAKGGPSSSSPRGAGANRHSSANLSVTSANMSISSTISSGAMIGGAQQQQRRSRSSDPTPQTQAAAVKSRASYADPSVPPPNVANTVLAELMSVRGGLGATAGTARPAAPRTRSANVGGNSAAANASVSSLASSSAAARPSAAASSTPTTRPSAPPVPVPLRHTEAAAATSSAAQSRSSSSAAAAPDARRPSGGGNGQMSSSRPPNAGAAHPAGIASNTIFQRTATDSGGPSAQRKAIGGGGLVWPRVGGATPQQQSTNPPSSVQPLLAAARGGTAGQHVGGVGGAPLSRTPSGSSLAQRGARV